MYQSFLRALLCACSAAAFAAIAATGAHACDLCAIYTATVLQERRTGLWVGVAEQFTSFNTVRDGDDTLDNEAGEWMQSSITQLIVGGTLHPRFTLQIAVPLISREFRRLHEGEIERGDSSGLGDMSVLAVVNAFERISDNSILRVDLVGGLKLPTGDSDYLAEEQHDGDAHDEEHTGGPVVRPGTGGSRHEAGEDDGHSDESGVHGHDLALGSGSIDGVFGLALFASWRRAFFEGELQYLARGDGDFDYQFADDLTWAAGPGMFVSLGDRHSAALQAFLTGETKGKDEQAGEVLDDTAITALYMGPRVIGTYKESLHADVSIEWPLLQNVTSVQIVPDYRLRAGLSWRF